MSDNLNGMPGAGAMHDTLDWVRNVWGSMRIPGMGMPSLSPDEINKQITDLKAVESWLQMNMNMLRSTIQTLEVQSATLTALQSMSDSFARASSATGAASAGKPDEGKPAFESPFQSASQSPFQSPFASAAGSGAAGTPDAPNAPDAAALAAQFANPAAWWNNVQEQFSKAVGTAMTPPKKAAKKRSPSTAKKRSTTSRKSPTKN